MEALGNKEMWTAEHWALFNELENIYRTKFSGSKDGKGFGTNFEEFKRHMLYILNIMEHEYGKNSSTK